MENHISEKLRTFTSWREQGIEKVQRIFRFPRLESILYFHIVVFLATLLISVAIFTQRSIDLLSYHAFFMTLGFLFFFAEGIVVYRNQVAIEIFSPIMQHNSLTKFRSIHQTFQLLGTSCIVLGFSMILLKNILSNKPFFSLTIHPIAGYITLFVTVIQVQSGLKKFEFFQVASTHTPIKKWHADVGLMIWDFSCLTIMLGMTQFFPRTFTSWIIGGFLFAAWLSVHLQMGKKLSENEAEYREHLLELEKSQDQQDENYDFYDAEDITE